MLRFEVHRHQQAIATGDFLGSAIASPTAVKSTDINERSPSPCNAEMMTQRKVRSRLKLYDCDRLLVRFEVHRHQQAIATGDLSGSAIASPTALKSGVWRVAFAVDPKRKAILLVAGDKSGVSEKRFYRQLIKKADKRFGSHLKGI